MISQPLQTRGGDAPAPYTSRAGKPAAGQLYVPVAAGVRGRGSGP